MRSLLPVAVAFWFFGAVATAAGQGGPDVDGDWEAMAPPAVEGGPGLYLMLTLKRTGTRLDAQVRVGAPNAAPVVAVGRAAGRTVTLDLGANGKFEGAYADEAGPSLVGAWTAAGRKVDLVFRRPAPRKYDLFQQPPPPHPYRTENLSFPSAAPAVRLAATVVVPAGAGPFPAVVLLQGLGAFDRDETMGEFRPLYALAHALALRGVASIRFDKRGVGGSSGAWVGVSPAALADDARAAADVLRGRPDVVPARVGYMGHSEGGLVALLAAGKDARAACVVALAPPLLGGAEQAAAMLDSVGEAGAAPALAALLGKVAVARIAEVLREEPDDAKAAAKLSFLPKELRPQLVSPWGRFYLGHDARATTLPAVKCPLRATFFAHDPLVPGEKNVAILRAASSADPTTAIEYLTDVDHFLRPVAPAGPELGKPWRLETVESRLLERTLAWTIARLAAAQPK
jgi:dienelactone hydrolase